MCQERISRPIAVIASLLTAGRKLTKCFPHVAIHLGSAACPAL
jgi:hypothetical protein